MKKHSIFLCPLILLLAVTGCYLGDRQSLSKTISLNLQASNGTNSFNLSLTNIEVQQAVKVVDAVLSTNGFIREARPDMSGEPGFVASYVQYDSSGLRLATSPYLYLSEGRLNLQIVELGNRTTHPTVFADKICRSLQKELGTRYGSASVEVYN